MDRFAGNFVVFELQRELYHKKREQAPCKDVEKESIYDKLWMDLKSPELIELIIERARYGFNADWDLCRLKGLTNPISVCVPIHTKEQVKLEPNTILSDTPIEVDEAVKQWVDSNVIQAYAITSGKKKITLEDLPKLNAFYKKK